MKTMAATEHNIRLTAETIITSQLAFGHSISH